MFAPTQAAKRPSWPSAPCLEPRLERWEPCPQPGSGESLGLPEAAACSLGRHSDPRAGPQRMLVSGAGASLVGVRGGSGLARRPGTSQAFLASVSLLGTRSSHPWLGARGVTCLFVGSHRKRWRLGCLAGLCWCSCRAQGQAEACGDRAGGVSGVARSGPAAGLRVRSTRGWRSRCVGPFGLPLFQNLSPSMLCCVRVEKPDSRVPWV